MSFEDFTQIIKRAKDRFPGFSKRLDEAEAVSRWADAVGPMISKHARAKTVRNSVLWVEVDHAIWRTELHHRKSQILAILNDGISETEVLTDIFFVDPKKTSSAPKFLQKNKQKSAADHKK